MFYTDAKKVKVGDTLLCRVNNNCPTQVLAIKHDRRYHIFTFVCSHGEYTHKQFLPPAENIEGI